MKTFWMKFAVFVTLAATGIVVAGIAIPPDARGVNNFDFWDKKRIGYVGEGDVVVHGSSWALFSSAIPSVMERELPGLQVVNLSFMLAQMTPRFFERIEECLNPNSPNPTAVLLIAVPMFTDDGSLWIPWLESKAPELPGRQYHQWTGETGWNDMAGPAIFRRMSPGEMVFSKTLSLRRTYSEDGVLLFEPYIATLYPTVVWFNKMWHYEPEIADRLVAWSDRMRGKGVTVVIAPLPQLSFHGEPSRVRAYEDPDWYGELRGRLEAVGANWLEFDDRYETVDELHFTPASGARFSRDLAIRIREIHERRRQPPRTRGAGAAPVAP